jgi:hypothetical protein
MISDSGRFLGRLVLVMLVMSPYNTDSGRFLGQLFSGTSDVS